MAKREHVEHFASLADFADAAEKRETNRRQYGAREFTGNVDFAGALELARNGWQAGAERVKALADAIMQRIAPAVACVGLEHQAGGGSLVDVDRFIAGDPECYMEFAPAESRKHVTIEANGGTGNTTAAASIERRGAAILAAVLALKARGITADVIWSYRAANRREVKHGDGCTHSVTVAICNGREWLDVESLAFALVHPAMLRLLCFGVQDALPKSWNLADKNRYGFPVNAKLTQAQTFAHAMSKHDCATDTQALELALDLCAQCGARLDGLDAA